MNLIIHLQKNLQKSLDERAKAAACPGLQTISIMLWTQGKKLHLSINYSAAIN